jgi:hypothetical protein
VENKLISALVKAATRRESRAGLDRTRRAGERGSKKTGCKCPKNAEAVWIAKIRALNSVTQYAKRIQMAKTSNE